MQTVYLTDIWWLQEFLGCWTIWKVKVQKSFLKAWHEEAIPKGQTVHPLWGFTLSNRVRVQMGGVGILHSISKLSFSLIPVPWRTKGIPDIWTLNSNTSWKGFEVNLLNAQIPGSKGLFLPTILSHSCQILEIKIHFVV